MNTQHQQQHQQQPGITGRSARAVVTPADAEDVQRLAALLLKLAPGDEIRVLTGGPLPVFEVDADVADEVARQREAEQAERAEQAEHEQHETHSRSRTGHKR